jgi:LmbE family N-acetylglucosaminyl deacetylase
MTKKIIVVAVHPDDETLGCGGTLLKHKAQGDEIFWLICTTQTSPLTEKERQENLASVALHYAFDAVHHLNLVTTTVDTYSMSTLVSAISAIFSQVQPDTVYLPFKSDVHSDHRKIFEAAYSCTKSFRYPSIKKVLMMETLSETEFAPATKEDCFIPNVFIDISAYFDKKCAILGLYQQELGLHPFPRSIRNVTALATLRGATSGCDYAESFMLLKEIA